MLKSEVVGNKGQNAEEKNAEKEVYCKGKSYKILDGNEDYIENWTKDRACFIL